MNRWLCKPWCIGIITLFLVGADQLTKVLAVRFLKGQDPFVLWDGVFELRYLENRGAAFGIFQGQRTFFLVMGLLVFAAGVFLFLHMSKEARFLPLRLVGIFVMAGAWGNMLDRLRLSYVVDFFYFKLIDFPVFNVADIYVSVAVAVFALLIFFFYTDEDLQKLFVKNPGEERGAGDE